MESIMSFLRVKKQLRVSMMGLDAAGKTSIIQRLQKGASNGGGGTSLGAVLPTNGFGVERVKFRSAFLEICDAGGQDSLRPLWRHYLKAINALVFVIDSTDTERLGDAKSELHAVIGAARENDEDEFAVLVMANKQDLPGAVRADRLALALDMKALRSRRWHVQASSAKTGEGLKEGFKWILANRKPAARGSTFFDVA